MTPSTKLIAVLGDISVFLSLLASVPYELGPAAEILPPVVKESVVKVSIFAYFALRMIQRYVEGKPLPQEVPPPES